MQIIDNIDLFRCFRIILSIVLIGSIPILWEIGRGLRYKYDIDLTGLYIISFIVIVVIPVTTLLIFVWNV